jgi:hypothetical protein
MIITLFTDFGNDGLYVGQMHAVIAASLPDVKVVDLCHSLPLQNIKSAAYLLPAYSHYLPPASVTVCVVDPDVGGTRPHAVCLADGRWFIGPDNGMFDVLAQHTDHFEKTYFTWPGQVSSSFHGRDVYAPAACLLAEAGTSDVLDCKDVVQAESDYPEDLPEIVFFDHFGNAITGLRRSSLPKEVSIAVAGQDLSEANTFSDVIEGNCFWYENSNGLVEIAVNKGSARDKLNLVLGSTVEVC